jgi:hypothetical protein
MANTYGEALTQMERAARAHERDTHHKVARFETFGAAGRQCSACEWSEQIATSDYPAEPSS